MRSRNTTQHKKKMFFRCLNEKRSEEMEKKIVVAIEDFSFAIFHLQLLLRRSRWCRVWKSRCSGGLE